MQLTKNLTSAAPYLFFAVVSFAVYSPVITERYGLMDDYALVEIFHDGALLQLETIITELGRPVTSIISSFAFHGITDVASFQRLRLLGLLFTVFSVFTLLYGLRYFGICPNLSLLLGAIVLLNPATAVYVAWSVCFPYPIAITLSFLVGFLLFSSSGEKPCYLYELAAIIFTIISLMIYQAIAFASLAVLLVLHFDHYRKTSSLLLGKWLRGGALILASTVLYFVLHKALLHFLFEETTHQSRLTLVGDPWAKLLFLFTDPIPSLFTSWARVLGYWMIPVGSGVLLLTLIAFFRSSAPPERNGNDPPPEGGRRSPFQLSFSSRQGARPALLVMWALSILIALLPLAITAQDYAPFRTQFSGYLIVAFAAALGLMSLLRVRGFSPVAIILILALSVTTNWFVRNGLVAPHAHEFSLFEEHVRTLERDLEPGDPIFFLVPVTYIGNFTNDWPINHEFFTHSAWLPWVPENLVHLILLTHGWSRENLPEVIQIYPWQQVEIPSEHHRVIDGFEILRGESVRPFEWRTNPIPGFFPEDLTDPDTGELIKVLNNDWFFSRSRGFWNTASGRSIPLSSIQELKPS